MKLLLLPMVCWLALTGCALFHDGASTITAQVYTRPSAGHYLEAKERFGVEFTVREPAALRGAQFYYVTLATEPAEVEKKFFRGGVWKIRLPQSTIQQLKRQLAVRKYTSQQVKAGIDPLEISQTYSASVVRCETLLSEPRMVGGD